MTTQVKVSAHCATTKAVEISITDGPVGETVFLEDGQTWERAVYDKRSITVREIVKPVPQTAP